MGPPFRKANWNISFHYKEQTAAFTQHTQSCVEMRGVMTRKRGKNLWSERKLGWFHFFCHQSSDSFFSEGKKVPEEADAGDG